MHRTISLTALIVSVVACNGIFAHRVSGQGTPNVLFILADDLGYMDVNSFAERVSGTPTAQQFYETPNIDRLAEQGVSFTQAYATQLCAPTRAALMTGKYAARLGFTTATPGAIRNYYNQGLTPPAGFQLHDMLPQTSAPSGTPLLRGTTLMALPTGQAVGEPDATTFVEAMSGHHRAFTGKWHLGSHGATGYQPQDNGFDEVLSHVDAGSSPYFGWRNTFLNGKNQFTQENLGSIGPFDSGEDYLTDDMGSRAADYILRRNQNAPNDPWMLEVSLLAVHTPLQAKQTDIDYFDAKPTKGWNGHDDSTYAGMIKSMDDAVGQILDTLEATGEIDNTVVVFMSDNGGLTPRTVGSNSPTSNTPLRGGKAQLYEGGVRVPLIVSAPFLNHPTNVTSDAIVDATDIAPTLLDLSGYDSTAFVNQVDGDGQSLRPLLMDGANSNNEFIRDTVYYHYPYYVGVTDPSTPPTSAIRKGDWKLVVDETGYAELFDIANDVSEQIDLSSVHPEIAGRLYWQLRQWQTEEVPERYRVQPNPNYNPNASSQWRPYRDLNQIYAEYQFASIPGDYNLDGNVDGLDLQKWNLDVGTTGNSTADGNGDGVVSGLDFLMLQRHFGDTIYAPASDVEYVFLDTFDVSADTSDANFELDAPGWRQGGGLLSTTYTPEGLSGGVGLEKRQNVNGTDGVLRLVTSGGANPAPRVAELNLDTDFGPSLAGKTWTLEYDAYSEFTPVGLTGNTWVAVSVGDDPNFDGPSNSAADFALLLRPQNGNVVLWRDGIATNLGNEAIEDSSDADSILEGDRYHTEIQFVETADGLTATVHVTFTMLEGVNFDIPGATTVLDPFEINFDDLERYVEFKAFNGSFLSGEQQEFRIDNLRITTQGAGANVDSLATVVPEPGTVILLIFSMCYLSLSRNGRRSS